MRNNKDSCGLCRYCTYENEYKEYVCHNEGSGNYGKILPYDVVKREPCADFARHEYFAMSLKKALKIMTMPDGLVTMTAFRKLPNNHQHYACVALTFKSNKDLEEWRDAHTRTFMEYMDLAQKDGDFEDSGEEEADHE